MDRHYLVLFVMVALALACFAMAFATGSGHAAEKCVSPAAFLASVEKKGGIGTSIPDANYPKARALLDAIKKDAKPSDAAWFFQLDAQAFAVVFSLKNCITAALMVPPSVSAEKLRGALLGERLSAPSPVHVPAGLGGLGI